MAEVTASCGEPPRPQCGTAVPPGQPAVPVVPVGRFPAVGAYCAAKAAEWSLTNALRMELASQGTRVSSLHVGYMDTHLARNVTDPKSDPADIARIALDGIAAGETEIVADEISKQVLAGLSSGVRGLYPQVA